MPPVSDDARRAILPELNRFADLLDQWEAETTEHLAAAREKLAAIQVALQGAGTEPTESEQPA